MASWSKLSETAAAGWLGEKFTVTSFLEVVNHRRLHKLPTCLLPLPYPPSTARSSPIDPDQNPQCCAPP